MLDTYEGESGFRPANESDIMLRLRVLAGEIYRERVYAQYIMRQMFPATATGEYLDAHAEQRGLSRKNGTVASGHVIFLTASSDHGNILIPAGTQLCTNDGQLRFTTDSDAILSSGSQSVTAGAHAVQEGSAYNILVGKIAVMVTPIAGISVVKNNERFTGGSDRESDEQLRARVIESYQTISNGANAAYYRSAAMSVDGVYSASVIGCARGAGTVDVYACARGAVLSNEKIAEIQTLLNEKREVNVDVRAVSPTAMNINLYIRLTVAEGYDFDTVAANVREAVVDYINGLGIGNDLRLSKVGEVVYHIEGVADYKFLESYGSDREVPLNRFAKANTITVRDE
ncbi:MAG: baseplate J/gp47 family protein [Ruminococcus sp.]|nr:baseplate J/gp47 family protein [Ruminococcus sp.]